jgi:hypothetical protein
MNEFLKTVLWQQFGRTLLENIRHVQHHTAQLNFLLRQEIDDAPKWVTRTQKKLTA